MRAKRKRWNPTLDLPPAYMRGPDEPTEYDLAAKALGPDELTAWIRKWYWTKYVPEEVLIKMGLAERY